MRHLTNDWIGAYDNRATRDLYIDEDSSGLGILILDRWGGSDIEGKCYREHIYYLDQEQVVEAIKAWDDADVWEYYLYYRQAASFAESHQGKRWGGGDPEVALKRWVNRYHYHSKTGQWARSV